MYKSKYIQFKVYFEGVRLDVENIRIVEQYGKPTQIYIQLPYSSYIGNIYKNTIIHIFYKDKYDKESDYRYLIEGYVKKIVRYRNGMSENYEILAVDDTNILDELPSRYLLAMPINLLTIRSKLKFYHISENNKDIMLKLWRKSMKMIERSKDSVHQYIKSFFDLYDNNWEYFYKNFARRSNISNEIAIMSFDFIRKRAIKEALDKLLKIKTEMLTSTINASTFTEMLNVLNIMGFEFYRILLPPKVDKTENKFDSQIKWINPRNNFVRYALIGSTNNSLPPKCNIIAYHNLGIMNINIGDIDITRYRQIYRVVTSGVETYLDYPSDELNKNNYGLMPSEYDEGIKAYIDYSNQSIFSYMLGKFDVNKYRSLIKNKFFKKKIEYDYYNIVYRNNNITCNIPEYDPYSIVGMPMLLQDKKMRRVYYGKLFARTLDASIKLGKVQTSYVLLYAREINDLQEVSNIGNPYLLSDNIETAYEHILRDGKSNGYKLTDNIDDEKEERYGIDESEYWKLRKSTDSDGNGIIPIKKLITRENFAKKDIDLSKQYFVKERQDVIKSIEKDIEGVW